MKLLLQIKIFKFHIYFVNERSIAHPSKSIITFFLSLSEGKKLIRRALKISLKKHQKINKKGFEKELYNSLSKEHYQIFYKDTKLSTNNFI